MATDAEYQARFPALPWWTPLRIVYAGTGRAHYACRFCAARHGLAGPAIPLLPTEPGPVLRHLRTEHAGAGSNGSPYGAA